MASPESQAVQDIIEQNIAELPTVFRNWMDLPDPFTPQAKNRLGEVRGLFRATRSNEDALKWSDEYVNMLSLLMNVGEFRSAILQAHQPLKEVSGQFNVQRTHVAYLGRMEAQYCFAKYITTNKPLTIGDEERSKIYISAGADGLRADLAINFVSIDELVKVAELFGYAGMPKLQFAIWSRGDTSNTVELLTMQVPRSPVIETLEQWLLAGVELDYRRLHILDQ